MNNQEPFKLKMNAIRHFFPDDCAKHTALFVKESVEMLSEFRRFRKRGYFPFYQAKYMFDVKKVQ